MPSCSRKFSNTSLLAKKYRKTKGTLVTWINSFGIGTGDSSWDDQKQASLIEEIKVFFLSVYCLNFCYMYTHARAHTRYAEMHFQT